MTKREQILSALLTSLKTVGTVPAAKITRSKIDPYSGSKIPAISLEPVNDRIQDISLSYQDWILTFRISIYASGDVPDQVADPIVESVHNKMMSDLTVGNLAMDLSPKSINYEFDQAEAQFVGVHYEFDLHYRTLI